MPLGWPSPFQPGVSARETEGGDNDVRLPGTPRRRRRRRWKTNLRHENVFILVILLLLFSSYYGGVLSLTSQKKKKKTVFSHSNARLLFRTVSTHAPLYPIAVTTSYFQIMLLKRYACLCFFNDHCALLPKSLTSYLPGPIAPQYYAV